MKTKDYIEIKDKVLKYRKIIRPLWLLNSIINDEYDKYELREVYDNLNKRKIQ